MWVVKGSTARTQPVRVIVVGMVTSDRAHLDLHGNLNRNFLSDDKIEKAKLQFRIGRPNDPDFEDDFETAFKNFQTIQGQVAETDIREHFLDARNEKIILNYQLFQRRTEDSDADEELMATSNQYHVSSDFEEAWQRCKAKHYNTVLPVFDTDEEAVPPQRFADVLKPGTLVEVSFILKHWPIGGKTNPTSDTFGAHLELVNILKDAPPPLSSPYRAKGRRPMHVPQTPVTPSRSELKGAADAFIGIKQPVFIASSPTASNGSTSSAKGKEKAITEEWTSAQDEQVFNEARNEKSDTTEKDQVNLAGKETVEEEGKQRGKKKAKTQ